MRIGGKGQVSIPVEIRRMAGLSPRTLRAKPSPSIGGVRRSPLPDFCIGAHALVSGMMLLTRDGSRYQSHFPKLKIVSV